MTHLRRNNTKSEYFTFPASCIKQHKYQPGHVGFQRLVLPDLRYRQVHVRSIFFEYVSRRYTPIITSLSNSQSVLGDARSA